MDPLLLIFIFVLSIGGGYVGRLIRERLRRFGYSPVVHIDARDLRVGDRFIDFTDGSRSVSADEASRLGTAITGVSNRDRGGILLELEEGDPMRLTVTAYYVGPPAVDEGDEVEWWSAPVLARLRLPTRP